MTQTEQIVWHKYPEEKPQVHGNYLCDNRAFVDVAYFNGGDTWFENLFSDNIIDNVTAWAIMPKGWVEEVKSQDK